MLVPTGSSRGRVTDAADLDRRFDEGEEEILGYFDVDSATRPNRRVKRVNVDFPEWVVEALDREAQRLGVTRQSIIKVWIAERLERPD
ncbi:CopG family transcriptional regulator [Limnoraphis robusta CCNP1324]|uniref:type II toxin-antitoxin system BrnA family antitoxin n=1 Tax=Limnoraphis robusta TaxID=1118279 RepID=UPI002B204FBC|nr:CopG family transcriptional regulator [Limnoraphis robusta]MEA5547654.1 CopG family transcriptional regulator [Limnoraphis robusta CCNP1324]